MDPISSPAGPQPPLSTGPNLNAAVAILQRQCRDLRILLLAIVGTLILLSLGVNLFFVRQWRSVDLQLREQRSVLQRVLTEYRTIKEPRLKGFLTQLHQFAVTNRDFQPLLEKYRPVLEAYYPPRLTPATAPASRSLGPVGTK